MIKISNHTSLLLLFFMIGTLFGCKKTPEETVIHTPNEYEKGILSWLEQGQLQNGLIESTENAGIVSLYDQALAAMVFMLNDDIGRAELIFDFFNDRRSVELNAPPGGFSQFRAVNGTPYNHRWMGDNAWFLIALHQYKALTGRNKYDSLAIDLQTWLVSLQDTLDGGLWAGYDDQDQLLNYKVTEGNIDAFVAIPGYSNFHTQVLSFFGSDRWNINEQALMAWPENEPYRYALDNYSWAYCAFDEYPESTVIAADRFLNDQTTTITNATIRGYDIDEDLDAIFMEGTGQMALAWKLHGNLTKCNVYLGALERSLIWSTTRPGAGGFPYASNPGTAYGSEPYWSGADTEIAISPGAWYIFSRRGFNPLSIGKEKTIPPPDRFWIR